MERIEDGFIMSDELTVRGPEITFQKKDREWKVTGRYQIEDARRTNQKPHKIEVEISHDIESMANGNPAESIDVEKMGVLLERFFERVKQTTDVDS